MQTISNGHALGSNEAVFMTITALTLELLLLLVVGSLPAWASGDGPWEYGPSGGLGPLLLVALAMFQWGRL